jgi:type I restriction enzyme R subunit
MSSSPSPKPKAWEIEDLNKILERAVNLKNFLKGKPRIEQVARFVVDHYLNNVEPLGYKAFLVAVDREACALYKQALDAIFTELGLPTAYAQVVFTGNSNDTALLKQYHLDTKQAGSLGSPVTGGAGTILLSCKSN